MVSAERRRWRAGGGGAEALAPGLARRFVAIPAGPHEALWLTSRGQIDFYDQPALNGAAGAQS